MIEGLTKPYWGNYPGDFVGHDRLRDLLWRLDRRGGRSSVEDTPLSRREANSRMALIGIYSGDSLD